MDISQYETPDIFDSPLSLICGLLILILLFVIFSILLILKILDTKRTATLLLIILGINLCFAIICSLIFTIIKVPVTQIKTNKEDLAKNSRELSTVIEEKWNFTLNKNDISHILISIDEGYINPTEISVTDINTNEIYSVYYNINDDNILNFYTYDKNTDKYIGIETTD